METREFNGVLYEVVKTPCRCPCHTPGMRILHCMPCCNGGFIIHHRKLESTNLPDNEQEKETA